jgi:hypothetical protein
MNSNNPILQIIEEAKWGFGQDKPFDAIVSIGTGKGPIENPSSHLLGVVQYAIHQMTDTQRKHTEFAERYPGLGSKYFRFNEEGDLYRIDLADWKQLHRVEQLANEYVTTSQVVTQIKSCARKLARRGVG